MKSFLRIFAVVGGLCGAFGPACGQSLDSTWTTLNPVIDGVVGEPEWGYAGYAPDGNGLAGATYAMWKQSLTYGATSYTGTFQFMLHNIEQLPVTASDAYNVFDIYSATNSVTPLLTVWVFDGVDAANDSWMIPSGLSSFVAGATSINDTGFFVVNHSLNEYRLFTAGMLRPEDGNYDWDQYWGIYAAGGYNNSAFESKLSGAIDGSNQLFELVYRAEDAGGSVRRSLKDPDKSPADMPPVQYFDGMVNSVPEPATYALFAVGIAVLFFVSWRRSKQT